MFLEQNRNFPKRNWVRSKIVFLSSAGLFSLVVTKKNLFWELAQISLHETIRVFCSNAESRFGCPFFRTLRSVLWLFTSCVWDVLRYRILVETAFDFFGNVVFVVLYCMQWFWWFSYKPSEKFWAISPKEKHQLSKMTLSTFQKCLFVSSALLFSLVVTKKYVFRTSWGLFLWNNTCFLFKCRVTFRLRQFSKVRFGTLAFYILRLRCLVISNTYKNSFCFLSKTEPFQNDVGYVPKMSVWALLGLILWL